MIATLLRIAASPGSMIHWRDCELANKYLFDLIVSNFGRGSLLSEGTWRIFFSQSLLFGLYFAGNFAAATTGD